MPTETTTDMSRQLLAVPGLIFEHFATAPSSPMERQTNGAQRSEYASCGVLGMRLEETADSTAVSFYPDLQMASDFSSAFLSIGQVEVKLESVGVHCPEHRHEVLRRLRLMVEIDLNTRYASIFDDIATMPAILRQFESIIEYVDGQVVALGPELQSHLPLVCPIGPHLSAPV